MRIAHPGANLFALIGGLAALVMGMGAGPSMSRADAPKQAGAPPVACSTIIAGFNAAINACRELNDNYACYGTFVTQGEPATVRFFAPKDRSPIDELKAIRTLRGTNDAIGAAVMRLHLPGRGSPLTAILFGDATLGPRDAAGGKVFLMSTASGTQVCDETPPGLMVRSEQNQSGRITVNNVEIVLSSTAFITLLPGERMVVANLEGNVAVSVPSLGRSVSLPVGSQVIIQERQGVPVDMEPMTASPYFASEALTWLGSTGLPQVYDPNTDSDSAIPACGGRIAMSQTVKKENFASGQECLYTFCGNAGDHVTIAMYTLQGTLDPYLDLRAPDQTLIKWNNDIRPADTNSLICNRRLPVTGCYTIVARSHRNDSLGSFRLDLLGDTACQPIESECGVSTYAGTNLREGPGLQYPALRALPFDAHLQPLGWNEDYSWVQVRTTDTSDRGWVSAQYAYCDVTPGRVEPDSGRESPQSVPEPQPEPKPEPTKTPPKLSPYPGP